MNILCASKICPEAIQKLRADHHVNCAWDAGPEMLSVLIKETEVLVFRSGVQITAELMEAAPRLKLLVRAGSGLDNLDLDYVEKRGIELQRIPEPGARAVAELAVGLMMVLARQIMIADKELRKGHWLKHEVKGYLLQNKTLGLVGCGNIGTTVGELALALGMTVVACVAQPTQARADHMARKGIRLVSFPSVLRQADFLSLHVPLDTSTRHLLGEGEFRQMKPGSYLVNLARGGVVDERALCRALTDGDGLAGAALDVHALEGEGRVSPLAVLDSVVLTPHIGATTVDTQREIGERLLALVAVASQSTTLAKKGPWRCNDVCQINPA